ncbi:hypothetical protein GCM10010517_82000 [Streptosporangium fragile]|uniref:Uncharacterized protein n=1 Tax=Streptosporangium fragile TaxID=46186 RepID=A0ABP6J1I3_9ACTN
MIGGVPVHDRLVRPQNAVQPLRRRVKAVAAYESSHAWEADPGGSTGIVQ